MLCGTPQAGRTAIAKKVVANLTVRRSDWGNGSTRKLVIPTVFLIQSIAVEYSEEYIIVEQVEKSCWPSRAGGSSAYHPLMCESCNGW